jgi:hypothetical protein
MIDNENVRMHIANGKYIVFVINGWDYDISFESVATIESLKEWLRHLGEKTWFKPHHQELMIEICEQKFGYDYVH